MPQNGVALVTIAMLLFHLPKAGRGNFPTCNGKRDFHFSFSVLTTLSSTPQRGTMVLVSTMSGSICFLYTDL